MEIEFKISDFNELDILECGIKIHTLWRNSRRRFIQLMGQNLDHIQGRQLSLRWLYMVQNMVERNLDICSTKHFGDLDFTQIELTLMFEFEQH